MRQVSAGGALGARAPDPAQLSSLREPGAQDPARPQAPQSPQTRTRPKHCEPGWLLAAIRSQRMGQRFPTTSRPGPTQWAAIVRSLQDTALSLSPGPQLTWRPETTRPGVPLGEGHSPPLSTLTDTRTSVQLTVGRAGSVTTTAAALMVAG